MAKLKKALQSTILLFGTIHVLILLYLTFTTRNVTFLNVFSILDINHFIPGIEIGITSTVISTVITAGIFIYYYKKKS